MVKNNCDVRVLRFGSRHTDVQWAPRAKSPRVLVPGREMSSLSARLIHVLTRKGVLGGFLL